MNARIGTTRRRADEDRRVAHVSAETALALMLDPAGRRMHPFPGKAVLHGAEKGNLNMVDAVAVWCGERAAALSWTALGAAPGTERLSLLELMPASGDALRIAVEALLPAARLRGVRQFEITIPWDADMIDEALLGAGLQVASRMCVGGVADVSLSLPAEG